MGSLTFDRDKLHEQLSLHEAVRPNLYDDVTGKPPLLAKFDASGTNLVLTHGKLSGGVGHNFTDVPLTHDQMQEILDDDIDDKVTLLLQQWPWLPNLSEARQRAVIDMAFNLGVHGLARDLPDVLWELERGCFECAAKRLEASHYYAEVKTRGVDLAAQLRNG
jgi:lysozyme